MMRSVPAIAGWRLKLSIASAIICSRPILLDALEALTLGRGLSGNEEPCGTWHGLQQSRSRVWRTGSEKPAAAQSARRSSTSESPFELLQSLNAVATVYHRMGDMANAGKHYERAGARREVQLATDTGLPSSKLRGLLLTGAATRLLPMRSSR
jgi:hypothetical protein